MRYLFIGTTVTILLLTACGPAATPETVLTPTPTTTLTPAQTTFDSLLLPMATPLPPAAGSPTSVETEPSGRQAVFPNTIIVYQRAGKFPGSPRQWTFYHTGRIVASDGTEWQVPAGEVEVLFRLVESPDFWGLGSNYAPSGECLDCLVHILTVYREGEIKEVTVIQELVAGPENLRRVLDEIAGLISVNLVETLGDDKEGRAKGTCWRFPTVR